MPLTSLFVFLTLVAHLTFVTQSTPQSESTYLPSIGAYSLVLQSGQYEYDDGQRRVYFTVGRPEWIESGGFSVPAPADEASCPRDSNYHFEQGVNTLSYYWWHLAYPEPIQHVYFVLNSSDVSPEATLRCEVVSNTRALCEYADYSVLKSIPNSKCGHDIVTVTRIE